MLQRRLLASILVFCFAVISSFVLAQQAPQGGGAGGNAAGGGRGNAPDPVKKAVQIKPNLWMIADGGANTVVEVTPEGLIVCDTKNPGADIEAALLAEIKSFSAMPVKFVF